jgi:hypothetical protein
MDIEQRTEMATSRMMFDRNKFGYLATCQEESDALTAKLNACRERLFSVKLDPALSLKVGSHSTPYQ